MEKFKTKQDGFKEIRKAIIIIGIQTSLLATFGGLVIFHFNTNGQHSSVSILPFFIPMVLGVIAFGLYIGIKRQKVIFDSYILTIDNSGITREQYNTPKITIPNEDISEIVKNLNGSFTIKDKSSLNVIGVPSQINDYEKLEKLLSDIRQISIKKSEPFLQKFRGLLSILTVGLMVAVYISTDKIIIGVSGAVLLTILGNSLFEIQRSKNIDNKTKKVMWWLILLIVTIGGVMYYKLTVQP